MSTADFAEKAPTASSLHTDRTASMETGDYGGVSGKNSPQNYQAAWLRHAYDGFPREFWDGGRSHKWQTIESRDAYLAALIAQREDFGPGHTSVNIGLGPVLSAKYVRPWINKIFLELDGSGGRPDVAYPEMRRLYSHLRLRYDAEPRIYFSGHRSFHVFVDFTPLALSEPVEAQREFAERCVKELNLKCLDLQVFAERKLSRIPYTLHEDTALNCIPISPFWSLQEIRAEASKPARFEPIRISFTERVAADLRGIDATLSSRPKPRRIAKGTTSAKWIDKLLNHPIGDGRHRALWHVFSPYLVNVRRVPFDQAETVLEEYLRKCGEVTPLHPSPYAFKRLTRYYLKLAERDGYPPWKLRTIEKLDPQLFDILKEAGVVEEPNEPSKEGRS